MKIKIICLGKIKDNNLSILIKNYIEKISHHINILVVEINEEKINNENNVGDIQEALKKEAIKISSFFDKSFNVLLDIEGNLIDSIKFANVINQNLLISKDINFYIGSSHGVHNELKPKFDLRISFSKLTFNHQIFRLLLLEQIYRGFSIIKNTKYHK